MTIRERINHLEALETVLLDIDNRMKDEMSFVFDESGDYLRDEVGNFVRTEPDPDASPYAYARYKAFQNLRNEVEKLANKF